MVELDANALLLKLTDANLKSVVPMLNVDLIKKESDNASALQTFLTEIPIKVVHHHLETNNVKRIRTVQLINHAFVEIVKIPALWEELVEQVLFAKSSITDQDVLVLNVTLEVHSFDVKPKGIANQNNLHQPNLKDVRLTRIVPMTSTARPMLACANLHVEQLQFVLPMNIVWPAYTKAVANVKINWS
jgi:hypothetical protein